MSLWDQHHAATIDLDAFRGHDQYLEQADHYPYAPILEACDPRILAAIDEDGAFGCVTRIIDGKRVSRDLLDSALEIAFLERTVPNVANMRAIDIGAGYGRLAHRLTTMHPGAFVYCTDAISVSQVACAKYLDHRGVTRASVVVPGDLDKTSAIELAINVHSWSECSLDEVCSWLDWIDTKRIPRIFIIPHTPTFGTWSPEHGGGNGPSYQSELKARKWALTHHWGGPECCPRTYSIWEKA